MLVQNYLCFEGRCEEAIDFYKKALGAEVEMILRFKDAPVKCDPCSMPSGSVDKVMHASFRIGESVLMATDMLRGPEKHPFQGFSLSLTCKDETEAHRRFNALAEGGEVHAPLAKTFFSPCFGVLVDRFGLSWMVMVPQS